MKKFLTGSCLLAFVLLMLAPAQAEDFKGFYAGVNVGAAYGSTDASTFTKFSPTGYFATTSPGAIGIAGLQELRPTRFTGGFQAGANARSGKWVYGVEADMNSMHLHDSATKSGVYPCCSPTGFTVTQTVNTDWLFTLRPRFGITSGRALFYGTGGLAVTNLNFQSQFTDTFATAAASVGYTENTRGWTAGGGIEFKTSTHWSLKGEFLRLEFGEFSKVSNNLTAFSPPIAFPTNPFTANFDASANLIRFGANYHF
ncbi:MAG TPA: outer membrane beta-barrel protein [Alphaproteobacteria bacterium]|nr:outer membrane beta-barrel protein [Alphaproteobacteria bacterium]